MLIRGKPITIYRQADPEWSSDVLGFSRPRPATLASKAQAASTLGAEGCAVAAIAAASGLGPTPMNPRQVNQAGQKGGAFVAGSGSMILERLAQAAGLWAPESLRVRMMDPGKPADRTKLADVINRSLLPAVGGGYFFDGGFCLINVDHRGDARPDHFILVTNTFGPGWSAGDPAPGGIVYVAPDMTAVSQWGADKDTHKPILKNYVIRGAAPIGVK